MHTPVLLNEVLDGLNIKKNGKYIDATAGEGGHLIEIASKAGKVLGIDADLNQIENLKLKIKNFKNITLAHGNYSDIEAIARKNDFLNTDGIIFDLGLSMFQISTSGRGFSYRNPDEPLDMRLDQTSPYTAANVLNDFSQDELYEIFSKYGEDINSLSLSQAIVRSRTLKKVTKVSDLTEIIDRVLNSRDKKTYSRIFQALRITVNNELDKLKKGLEGSIKILNKNGRIAVITFHSLEDRLVKQFSRQHGLRQINKKIIISGSRSGFERSAKLRIINYETV